MNKSFYKLGVPQMNEILKSRLASLIIVINETIENVDSSEMTIDELINFINNQNEFFNQKTIDRLLSLVELFFESDC